MNYPFISIVNVTAAPDAAVPDSVTVTGPEPGGRTTPEPCEFENFPSLPTRSLSGAAGAGLRDAPTTVACISELDWKPDASSAYAFDVEWRTRQARATPSEEQIDVDAAPRHAPVARAAASAR
jgi:hypothetical protein